MHEISCVYKKSFLFWQSKHCSLYKVGEFLLILIEKWRNRPSIPWTTIISASQKHRTLKKLQSESCELYLRFALLGLLYSADWFKNASHVLEFYEILLYYVLVKFFKLCLQILAAVHYTIPFNQQNIRVETMI